MNIKLDDMSGPHWSIWLAEDGPSVGDQVASNLVNKTDDAIIKPNKVTKIELGPRYNNMINDLLTHLDEYEILEVDSAATTANNSHLVTLKGHMSVMELYQILTKL